MEGRSNFFQSKQVCVLEVVVLEVVVLIVAYGCVDVACTSIKRNRECSLQDLHKYSYAI
jgi:hypothetical protein